jgi:hypothetical protein
MSQSETLRDPDIREFALFAKFFPWALIDVRRKV